jgi:hypothetical protein
LASDLLLYDRLVLPVPADEAERDRWFERGWDPDTVALRWAQAGGLVFTVPWTKELRQEHAHTAGLARLQGEVLYGHTAGLLSTSQTAWEAIMAGLHDDEVPDRHPFLIAAYQSEAEAKAALALHKVTNEHPGVRAADKIVAVTVRSMLEELVPGKPEDTFVDAAELAAKPEFEAARRSLFSYVDDLVTDETPLDEVAEEIASLAERYNQAVHDFGKSTRRRTVVTLLPKVLGAGLGLVGIPGAGPGGGAIGKVAGRFVAVSPDPARDPGRAFAMIRAAYRESPQH